MSAVVMVALSCVLAIHMGLIDAVEERLCFKFRVLNCTKCFTFWSVLALGALRRHGLVVSVATAFICSYLALWLDLGLSYLSKYYNRWYEKINTEADEADEDSLP